jgi:hypothetical protein
MRYDAFMRTTLTIDSDVRLLLERRMSERGQSLKEAVNDALRNGLTEAAPSEPFTTPTFDLGEPLSLAGELEDEELRRRLATRK